MQSTDWATLVLCIVAVIVEARRGSLTAWTDVVGMIVGLRGAEYIYPAIVSEALTPGRAYLLLFLSFLVLVGLISWQVQTATVKYSGPVDRLAGAFAGLLLGVAFSYGMFRYVLYSWGKNVPAFRDSVFRPIVHDFTWVGAIVDAVAGMGMQVGR
ncbi:MAG: CvpA family protein [Armatimonadetes bacterium]|nr:CvpA family protein [Armatimonadota bacterium]